jgi:hypothetical protein
MRAVVGVAGALALGLAGFAVLSFQRERKEVRIPIKKAYAVPRGSPAHDAVHEIDELQALVAGAEAPVGVEAYETKDRRIFVMPEVPRQAPQRTEHNGTVMLSDCALPHCVDVPLINQFNTMYYSAVKLGTPAQDFLLLFDTGSSNVWVQDKTCPSQICDCLVKSDECPQASKAHPKFDGSKSSTYKSMGDEQYELKYGTGSCKGALAEDTMVVGDLTATGQDFLHVVQVATPFNSAPFDGLVGLGFDGLATPSTAQPWLYTVAKEKQLSSVTVTFEMVDNKDGHLVIGEAQTGLYADSKIVWSDVLEFSIGYAFWAIGVDTIKVAGSEFHAAGGGSVPGIVDSGTSCLILPDQIFDAFQEGYERGGGDCSSGQCLGPCSGPSITYSISGYEYEITSDDYLQGGGSICAACVQNGGSGSTNMLLGDVFHRKYPITYDFDGKRVGLPTATPGGSSPPMTDVVVGCMCVLLLCSIFRCYARQRCCFSRQQNRGPRQGLFT